MEIQDGVQDGIQNGRQSFKNDQIEVSYYLQ